MKAVIAKKTNRKSISMKELEHFHDVCAAQWWHYKKTFGEDDVLTERAWDRLQSVTYVLRAFGWTDGAGGWYFNEAIFNSEMAIFDDYGKDYE